MLAKCLGRENLKLFFRVPEMSHKKLYPWPNSGKKPDITFSKLYYYSAYTPLFNELKLQW